MCFTSKDDPITTVSARLNVWSQEVAPDVDFSLSQVWLSTENGEMYGKWISQALISSVDCCWSTLEEGRTLLLEFHS